VIARRRRPPSMAARHSPPRQQCTARPTWTTHRRKGALRRRARTHVRCTLRPSRARRNERMCGAPYGRPVPAVHAQRSEPPCASAFSITCCTPPWSVAVYSGLHHSVLHPVPQTRVAVANARRRRVRHRAPAFWPHRTAHSAMRIGSADRREREDGGGGGGVAASGPPQLAGGGGWGRPGVGCSAVRSGLAGQEGGRRGGAGPLPH
jgi:hypothetical protein